jgi:uncharacterized protein YneF (UPF0154 family)
MMVTVAAIILISLALLGLAAILGGLFLSMRDLGEHERSPQLRDRSKQQDGGGIQR